MRRVVVVGRPRLVATSVVSAVSFSSTNIGTSAQRRHRIERDVRDHAESLLAIHAERFEAREQTLQGEPNTRRALAP